MLCPGIYLYGMSQRIHRFLSNNIAWSKCKILLFLFYHDEMQIELKHLRQFNLIIMSFNTDVNDFMTFDENLSSRQASKKKTNSRDYTTSYFN